MRFSLTSLSKKHFTEPILFDDSRTVIKRLRIGLSNKYVSSKRLRHHVWVYGLGVNVLVYFSVYSVDFLSYPRVCWFPSLPTTIRTGIWSSPPFLMVFDFD